MISKALSGFWVENGHSKCKGSSVRNLLLSSIWEIDGGVTVSSSGCSKKWSEFEIYGPVDILCKLLANWQSHIDHPEKLNNNR